MSEELTDDFVARALAKEARESNIQYSAMGLDAFLPKKPTNLPRPNTQFLRNIIKETDSHNAALLAKEAQESKARLQEFSTKQRGGDIRRRQLGDIAAILGGPSAKRRKLDEKAVEPERENKRRHASGGGELRRQSTHDDHTSSRRQKGNSYEVNEGRERRSSRTYRDDESSKTSRHHRRSRHKHDYEESDEEYSWRDEKRSARKDGETRERMRASRSHRQRSRSQSRERTNPEERRHHRWRRSHSPIPSNSDEEITGTHDGRHKTYDTNGKKRKYRRRSRSPLNSEIEVHRSRGHHSRKDEIRSRDSSSVTKKLDEERDRPSGQTKLAPKPDSDSDPLDEIIGPRPRPKSPVISRGRGKVSAASGIDSRFSANYDPTADVRLDFDEENDWEQALEALRDRQKWKQQGAERLRAAGFTEEEVEKWKSGGEKKEEDVKWSKAGEREWDRGKFWTDDGNVVTGADWGRLK